MFQYKDCLGDLEIRLACPAAEWMWSQGLHAYFFLKTVFPGIVIPMLKIRRSPDHLILNMGIPILVRWYLYIEMGHSTHFHIKTVFPGMVIPMLKIRRSGDPLIFNMGIPIPVRQHLYIETATAADWPYSAIASQILRTYTPYLTCELWQQHIYFTPIDDSHKWRHP